MPHIEGLNFENEEARYALIELIKTTFPELLKLVLTTHFFGNTHWASENRAHFIHLLSAAKLESMGCSITDNSNAESTSDTWSNTDTDLTSAQAAKLLRVSRGQINLLAEAGQFGELRRTFGGHRRISRIGALAYLRGSKVLKHS